MGTGKTVAYQASTAMGKGKGSNKIRQCLANAKVALVALAKLFGPSSPGGCLWLPSTYNTGRFLGSKRRHPISGKATRDKLG